MYTGQAMRTHLPASLWPGQSAVIASTAASQSTVTATFIGRHLRTCMGWMNFQLVSWVRASSTHTVATTQGLAWMRYRVGTIMFHSQGNPLKYLSAVIWSVRLIHSADRNSTTDATSTLPWWGSMLKRSMNSTGMTMQVT